MIPSWVRSGDGRTLVVLGADGFIGSHVARIALRSGWRIRGLCAKRPWRLAGVACPELWLAPAPTGRWWERGRAAQLQHALTGSDAVIMLSYEPPPQAAVSEDFELSVNVEGARRVAALAASEGVPVVFASSADVYGIGRPGLMSESDEPAPVTPYARAKLIAEHLIGEASTSATSLRLATVFGSTENGPRAIPTFICAYLRGEVPTIYGDGSDIKDYVRVEDVAAGMLNACEALLSSGTIPAALNLGSGIGRTTTAVLETIAELMAAEPLRRYEPVQRESRCVVLSTELARQYLQFRPVQEIEQALRVEAEWLGAHINRGTGAAAARGRG